MIQMKKLKNGTVTITGVTEGDLRLWQRAIDEGSFQGGDKGGDVSTALCRLAAALRVMLNWSHVEIIGGSADAAHLYDEADNLVTSSGGLTGVV